MIYQVCNRILPQEQLICVILWMEEGRKSLLNISHYATLGNDWGQDFLGLTEVWDGILQPANLLQYQEVSQHILHHKISRAFLMWWELVKYGYTRHFIILQINDSNMLNPKYLSYYLLIWIKFNPFNASCASRYLNWSKISVKRNKVLLRTFFFSFPVLGSPRSQHPASHIWSIKGFRARGDCTCFMPYNSNF